MNHCTKEQLIAFESGIAALWEAGELPYLLHLCGGNEDALIEIFREVQPGDWVFSSHRNHYHYLLSGGSPIRLRELICGGRSMFVFGCPNQSAAARMDAMKRGFAIDPKLQVHFLCSSILAGTCGIAAGVALELSLSPPPARPPHVWCFLGDGAEDEGHFYEAARFVDGRQLPCTFILEDNNRSVDTDRAQRHGPNWPEVVKTSAPFRCVRRYFYTPTYPHAGNGCDQRGVKIQIKDKGNPWL